MTYPGGKAGAGVSQKLINLMPPHSVYIEPFLGNAAVMRAKRPALLNIGLDLDPESPGLAWLATLGGKSAGRSLNAKSGAAAGTIVNGDGIRRRPSPDPARQRGCTRAPQIQAMGPESSPRSARRAAATPDPALQACIADCGDPAATADLASSADIVWRGEAANGIDFLLMYRFTGRELVYCDPPYLMSTRSGRRLYLCEMSDVDHRRLLRAVMSLPCMVMISGYHSTMYERELRGWNSIHYKAITRGGSLREEWLWFNFPRPAELHDYRYLGEGFRERERIKRKKARWTERLRRMPMLERQALLSAIADIGGSGDSGSVANGAH